MKKANRYTLVLTFLLSALFLILYLILQGFLKITEYLGDWFFYVTLGVSFLLLNEGFNWAKNGRRSEMADFVYIAFFFVVVYLFTRDIFNSFIGAFSIYLLIGIAELKDYQVINKLLYISVITYNFIFFMGLVTFYTDNPIYRDTAYSFSFWLILILGFAFFGRKYIVIWRFMSTQYLILALYLIAWVAVFTITRDTPYNLYSYIYEILIVTNLIVYFITGPVIDKMLALKPVDDPNLREIIREVAPKFGFKPESIKIRFGQYPIINAMAYGSIFDKHMGIIAPSLDKIPKDEMKGIVAHELSHHKGKHTLTLTLISCFEIFIRKLLKWPVSTYDYIFNPDQPFSMFWFIVINIVLAIFIYIFVRDLEARADLGTRNAGYAYELAKGLYNLESFYSYGREVGLNTMLLCDEKITEYNRKQDYFSTANYINTFLVKPSNMGLLSNLLNSHPPSYHRIYAILDEQSISPMKESVLPFVLMKEKKKQEFAKKTKDVRAKFIEIAQTKFYEEFSLKYIASYLKELKLIDQSSHKIGDLFVLKSNITGGLKFGKLLNMKYSEAIGTYLLYEMVEVDKSGLSKNGGIDSGNNAETLLIDPAEYTMTRIKLGAHYLIENEGVFELVSCDVESDVPSKKDEKKRKKWKKEQKKKKEGELDPYPPTGEYLFKCKDKIIRKPIKYFKMPLPISEFKEYVGKQVFLQSKGTLKRYLLQQIEIGEYNAKNKRLDISFSLQDEAGNIKQLKTPQVLIRPHHFAIQLHKDAELFQYEQQILEFIISNRIITDLFLKKPVNNRESGYIKKIIANYVENEQRSNAESKNSKSDSNGRTIQSNNHESKMPNNKENKDWNLSSAIEFENLFGNVMTIPYKQIEFISFENDSLLFIDLSEISFTTILGYKISKKIDPSKIYM